MILKDEKKVNNPYREDQDLGRRIDFHGEKLIVSSAPYALVLTRENGEEYGRVDVDFYFDAVEQCGDYLYIGLRSGQILMASLNDCKVIRRTWISNDAWENYQQHLSMSSQMHYAIHHHLLAETSYTRERNIMNDVVYRNAVTVLKRDAEGKRIAAGDSCGRVAVYSADDLKVLDQVETDGSILKLEFNPSGLLITHSMQKGVSDPSQLPLLPETYVVQAAFA